MSDQILVVGGGCAGAATALTLLQQGFQVTIIEKQGAYPDRVGETIQPPTVELLTRLGMDLGSFQHKHVESTGTSSAWGEPTISHNDFLNKGLGNGWHLNRAKFDHDLLELARQHGAQVYHHTAFVSAISSENRWQVSCKGEDGDTFTVKAGMVVDASGRSSKFARNQGADKVIFDDLHAVYTFWENTEGQPTSLQAWVESAELGWWYCAKLPDGQLAIGLMTDKFIIKEKSLSDFDRFQKQLDKTMHTKIRTMGYNPNGQCSIHVANSHLLYPVATDQWIAVGDAASAYDPLSSFGIHKAIQSGMDAAEAIALKYEGNLQAIAQYVTSVKTDFQAYLQMQSSYYQMEKRWPLSGFWQKRHKPIDTHPQCILAASPSPEEINHHRFLPNSALTKLLEICAGPIPAHEAVRQFHKRSQESFPDWQVVKAIDFLRERKAL